MGVTVASLDNAETLKLPGRELQWLVDSRTAGSEQLGIAIMTCPARAVVRPMHKHPGVEEVILILEGEGEAWVDGELAPFKKGDAVLFPADSKHQVRNTGDSALITASIFASAKAREQYILYEEDAFEDLQ